MRTERCERCPDEDTEACEECELVKQDIEEAEREAEANA